MNTRLGVALTLLLHAPLSAQSARIDANPPTPPALRTAVQAALAADAFAVVPEVRPEGTPDRWTAANREQRLRATFSAQGVRVGALDHPDTPSLVTLKLVAWGRAGALQAPAPPELVAEGARIEYRRGPLVEWYVNEPRGLEQGFTIEEAPPAGDRDAPLELQLALSGRLGAELAPDGLGFELRDEHGVARVTVSHLAAWDAEGRPLAAWMELSSGLLSVLVDTTGAAWPITVDPLIAGEQAKLTASDAAAGDSLGWSVALSGDTAVVGARFDDDGGDGAGSAYVFVRSGASWSQAAKLTASDAEAGDEFGNSVSLSGDTAVVGARFDDDGGAFAGSAYVFVRSGTSWSQQAKLTASDAEAGDAFGHSVAYWGDTAVVGVPFDDDGGDFAGSAYVFVRNGTSWSQQAKLTASDADVGDNVGSSVALSGDTAVVGAPWHDAGATSAGSAYVFVRSGTSWSQQAKLTASDAAVSDQLGDSVAVSGDTAVVGARRDDHAGGTDAGSAYVFVRSGTSWSEQAKLIASDAAVFDTFGNSVALSGDTAVVGNRFDDDDGDGAGSAYVFVRSGTSWSQAAKLTASDAEAGDNFGHSVALSGDAAVVGAVNDDDGGSSAGSAYVFDLDAEDCNGNDVSDEYDIAAGTSLDLDAEGTPDECQPLSADSASLSVAAGGTIGLTLDAGAAHAGELFLVLGSLSGSAPGISVHGFVLPLNLDVYLQITLGGGGLPQGGIGVLGGAGTAAASLVAPPGAIPASLTGQVVHHAYATVSFVTGRVTLTSNAIPTVLVP